MKPALRRLERLHALRSNLADAASLRIREIDGFLGEAQRSIEVLQRSTEASTGLPGASHDAAWPMFVASREAALRLQAVAVEQIATLQKSRAEAAESQRAALVGREQMSRLAEHCRMHCREEEDRREQMRLDEVHASALFRRAMPTRF